jgi:hypothetical protein
MWNLGRYFDHYLVDDFQYIREIHKVSPLCSIYIYYQVLDVNVS